MRWLKSTIKVVHARQAEHKRLLLSLATPILIQLSDSGEKCQRTMSAQVQCSLDGYLELKKPFWLFVLAGTNQGVVVRFWVVCSFERGGYVFGSKVVPRFKKLLHLHSYIVMWKPGLVQDTRHDFSNLSLWKLRFSTRFWTHLKDNTLQCWIALQNSSEGKSNQYVEQERKDS